MDLDSVSVNQSSTARWSLFHDLLRYASAGIDSIGLNRRKVEETGVTETADLLFEMQVKVTSLSEAGGFTGSNGLSFNNAVEDARQMIRAASLLRAGTLVIYPGGPNGHATSHLRRMLRLALDELVPLAEDLDVRLAIKPVVGPEAASLNFAGGFDAVHKLIEAYPAEHVGMVADLFYLARDCSATRDFPKFMERIALVQVSDLVQSCNGSFARCLPGAGCLPLTSWMNRLEYYRYNGPVELELHGPEFEFLGHDDLLIAVREFQLQHQQPVVFEEETNEDAEGDSGNWR